MNTDKVPHSMLNDVEKAKAVLKRHGCKEIFLCSAENARLQNPEEVIELGVRGLDPELFYHAYGEICFELEHGASMIDFGTRKRLFDFLSREGACFRIG
jgi:hypothetical protein